MQNYVVDSIVFCSPSLSISTYYLFMLPIKNSIKFEMKQSAETTKLFAINSCKYFN